MTHCKWTRDSTIKMQTLQVSRRIITIFGMCTLADGSGFGSKVGQIITMILALIMLIQLDWFSVCYVWQHLKVDDVQSSTFALMQVIAVFCTIASFILLIYHRTSVCHFFEQIQSIVVQCKFRKKLIFCLGDSLKICIFPDKSTTSAVIYIQTNKFCETFMVWVTLFMVVSYVASTIMPVIGGILYYHIKDGMVDTRNLYLPLKLK